MPSLVRTFIDLPGRSQAMVAMPSASMSVVKIGILVSLGAVASRRSAAGRLCGQKERAGARIVSLLVFGLLAENDCSPGFKAV